MAGIVPGKTDGESVGARLAMFSPLPAGARGGVTHDNGTEFARHTRLRDGPGMDTYFADPYSSRRRGSNENRNGMIRVFRQVGVSCLVMYFFRVGAGAVLLDSSLIPSPPIMPQDRARVDDP